MQFQSGNNKPLSPFTRPRSHLKDEKLDDLVTNPTNSEEFHTSHRDEKLDNSN